MAGNESFTIFKKECRLIMLNALMKSINNNTGDESKEFDLMRLLKACRIASMPLGIPTPN